MDLFLPKGSTFKTSQKWLSSKPKKGRVLAQSPGESASRDTYGFQVPAQYVETYKKYARIYQVEEEERSLRWDTFLATYRESAVPEAGILGSNHEGDGKAPGNTGRDEDSYVVDKAKRRGGGGDAKFKSNFRPELWLIEKAVHAKILSSNGKAAQMDTLAGRQGGGQGQSLSECGPGLPYSPSEPMAPSSDAASLEGSRTDSAVSAPELIGYKAQRGSKGRVFLQGREGAEGHFGRNTEGAGEGSLRSSSGLSSESEATLSETHRQGGLSIGGSVQGDAAEGVGAGLKGWSKRTNESGEGESDSGRRLGSGRVRCSSRDDDAALDSAGEGEREGDGDRGVVRERHESSTTDEDAQGSASASGRCGSDTPDDDSQAQSLSQLRSWSQRRSSGAVSGASDCSDTDAGGGVGLRTASEDAEEGSTRSQAQETGTELMERRGSVAGDDLGPREFSWAAWAQELNSLVMGGVPMALRGEVWQIFVGTKARRKEGQYDSMLEDVHREDEEDPNSSLAEIYARIRDKDPNNSFAVQIEKDLPRTFPGHPALDSIGRDSLRRLLTAYARKDPKVGYCQGMNFLGGLLLLLMPEENAFWTLSGIIDDYLKGYYSDDMVEAQVDQLAFEDLVRQNFPRLASHLEGLGVQISWVTGSWFLSLFVNVLPWESVLRVWDVMLYQRSRSMLFRTALALVEMHSVALLECKDTGDIMANMQSMTAATFDSSELVLRACVGYMDVDDEVLERLRVKHRPAVLARLEERKESLARYQETQRTAKGGTPGATRGGQDGVLAMPMGTGSQGRASGGGRYSVGRATDDLVVVPSAFEKLQAESLEQSLETRDRGRLGLNFPVWVTLQALPPRARLSRSSSLSRLSPSVRQMLGRELSPPIRRLLFPKTRATAITLLRSSTLLHRPLLHVQTQLWSARQHEQQLLTPHLPYNPALSRSPLTHLLRHHSDASAAMLASMTASPATNPKPSPTQNHQGPHTGSSTHIDGSDVSNAIGAGAGAGAGPGAGARASVRAGAGAGAGALAGGAPALYSSPGFRRAQPNPLTTVSELSLDGARALKFERVEARPAGRVEAGQGRGRGAGAQGQPQAQERAGAGGGSGAGAAKGKEVGGGLSFAQILAQASGATPVERARSVLSAWVEGTPEASPAGTAARDGGSSATGASSLPASGSEAGLASSWGSFLPSSRPSNLPERPGTSHGGGGSFWERPATSWGRRPAGSGGPGGAAGAAGGGGTRDWKAEAEVARQQAHVAGLPQSLMEELKKERATVADLREQVQWLKDQLVAALEAEQQATSRADELQSALVEMAARDKSQNLAVKFEAMEAEIETQRRELERGQQASTPLPSSLLADSSPAVLRGQFEAMEAEIETLRRELERGQRRSAEVLAGALAEKEKQAEEDLKQLLLVLAAKEDKLQADLEHLQAALEAKDAQHDRLMKEISRQQLEMKEKAEQLQANNKQVQTQKNVIDMLAEKNRSLLKELEEAKARALSSEGMLKAYMNASPAEAAYTTFENVSPSPGGSSPLTQEGAGGRGQGSRTASGVPEATSGNTGGSYPRVNLEAARLGKSLDRNEDDDDQ